MRFIGASPAHGELVRDREAVRDMVRSVASDVGDDVWVEKVDVCTRPVLDRDALRGRDDAIGELLATLDEVASDPERGRALLGEVSPLIEKLPIELREGLPALGDFLVEIEDMLLAALADHGGAP